MERITKDRQYLIYDKITGMYAQQGIERLQRKIEHLKEEIHYDGICKEINDDMEKMFMRK